MDLIPQIIVKPVGATCNLDCRYCYYTEKMDLYDDHPNFRHISKEVIEAHIRFVIAEHEKVNAAEICFSWQGGEPTLLGVDAYRTIVDLQNSLCPAGKKISNALQTNGTLINEEWAMFFAENDFLVGISIDGPAKLHDIHRKYRNGKPSHARVIEGLHCLQNANVDINTLTTVNRNNAKFPLEVYDYLKSLGVKHMQFIPVVERRKSNGTLSGPPDPDSPTENYTVTPWSVEPDDFGHFLCTIFDRWSVEDLGAIFIQTFEVHIGSWLGAPAGLCCFGETCGFAPALEYNGDLFACDHYVYPDYRLGNILQTPLHKLVNAPRQIAFGSVKNDSLPLTCHDCSYKFACYGGCPKHRFVAAPEGHAQNYLCKGYYQFFNHAEPVLRLISAGIQRRMPALQLRKMARNLRAEFTTAARGVKPGRNDPCPCGSGRKYKRCCAQAAQLRSTQGSPDSVLNEKLTHNLK